MLYLFLHCQSQWERAGMDGRRVGIPYDRLQIAAEARGVVLSEFFLDKFDLCVAEVIRYDGERIEAQANKNG